MVPAMCRNLAAISINALLPSGNDIGTASALCYRTTKAAARSHGAITFRLSGRCLRYSTAIA